MKQLNVKKLVLLNLPYFLLGLFATNLGEAWRLATGADASAKMLSFFSTLPVALGSWWPSLHPLDLAVGLCCGAGLRLAVYLKGKNAKKYRHNVEYGSARWGTHDDIAPYMDPVFQNNVILTQTERLTMSSRPKNPKYARNKNVLVIGGSGSGKALSLTPTEFSILRILCQKKGEVVSSEELFHEIWGDEYFSKSNNTITVHIRHLREKMDDSFENPKYIKTVWGCGYKIEK